MENRLVTFKSIACSINKFMSKTDLFDRDEEKKTSAVLEKNVTKWLHIRQDEQNSETPLYKFRSSAYKTKDVRHTTIVHDVT